MPEEYEYDRRKMQARVKRVIAPTLVPPKLVEGKIGVAECLDSGADVTMVKASIVKVTSILRRISRSLMSTEQKLHEG